MTMTTMIPRMKHRRLSSEEAAEGSSYPLVGGSNSVPVEANICGRKYQNKQMHSGYSCTVLRKEKSTHLNAWPFSYSTPASGDDDDSDDSDDEELQDDIDEADNDAPQTVRVAHRGGGKSLVRVSQADQQGEEDEDSDESEEEKAPVQAVRRTGGKMLSMMQPPPADDDSDVSL